MATFAFLFLPKYLLDKPYIVEYNSRDSQFISDADYICKKSFFEVRIQTKDIYEGYLQDKAEVETVCMKITEEIGGTRREDEMYDWLLEGTTASESSLEENESESLVSRLSELYQISNLISIVKLSMSVLLSGHFKIQIRFSQPTLSEI